MRSIVVRGGSLRLALVASLLMGCQGAAPLEDAKRTAPTFVAAPPAAAAPRADITAVLDEQALADPAAFARARARAEMSPPDTADADALARFYHRRGLAAGEVGRASQEIVDLRRAAELAARAGRSDQHEILLALVMAEIQAGHFSRGLDRTQEAIGKVPRFMEAWKLTFHATLAGAHARAGDLVAAGQALAEATRLHEKWRGSMFMPAVGAAASEASMAEARADLLAAQGDYAQAEPLYRRAVAAVAGNPELARLSWHDYLRGRLAEVLVRQGRHLEGEVEARAALLQSLRARGRNAAPTANALIVLAFAIAAQGRFAEVESLARAALDIHEKAGTSSDSLMLAVARVQLGASLAMQGRWRDTLAVYETVREAATGDPEAFARYLPAESIWAMALLETGEVDEALRLLHVALARSQRAGEQYLSTAQVRGLLGMAYLRKGDPERALEEFEAAAPLLIKPSFEIEQEETSRPMQEQIQGLILASYVRLLVDLRAKAPAGREPVGEAFRLAEAARGRSVQRAVDASAARMAAATPALADLARREQDARRQASALVTLLTDALARPTERQTPAAIAALRARIDAARAERQRLRGEIARAFPAYAELIDPQPVTLAAVRQRLAPGEALLATYVTADRTFVWAVPQRGAVAFAVAAIGGLGLADEIGALRRALDPSARTLADIPPFDIPRAARLYAMLLEPVADGWRNATSLLVVADGALGQLPFALLPTRATAADAESTPLFAGYRRVPWLVRTHGVTVLPSATSLVTLRALPTGDPTRRAFVGFGDPWFSREHSRPAPGGDAPVVTARGVTISVRAAAGGVSTRAFSALPRLPETADEIHSIAVAVGAVPQRDVFLGERANEHVVKSLDLSRYRVVAFATHGLVPDDLDGLTQPALALTASEIARVDGDGLLTMDEILALRLNADWVVLSACNTAAARGAGAEAVSGLGRAFFYAGARALLVSNWPVETTSARALTTDLFRRQQHDATLGRAAALRQTMNALIDDGGFIDPATGRLVFSYAHPIFWAPFSLVGDGG